MMSKKEKPVFDDMDDGVGFVFIAFCYAAFVLFCGLLIWLFFGSP